MTCCTFLRCPTPASYAVVAPYSRWYGCPEHAPAMVGALTCGTPTGTSVDLVPLSSAHKKQHGRGDPGAPVPVPGEQRALRSWRELPGADLVEQRR